VTHILLEEVKYIPEMKVNLFSLPFSLQKGASVQSEGKSLVIKKSNKEIYFSHKIPMETSFLLVAKLSKRTKMG
jgi:hypothetical protein